MTDRIHSITLILENDMRVDDAESLIHAARHLRGVIAVKGNVSDSTAYMAEERAKNQLISKVYEALKDA